MRITLADTAEITRDCFHGEPASCSHGCPYFFDIRTFLERTSEGKWNLAYKLLRDTFLFPSAVCSNCAGGCMSECQRQDIGDEPVDIPAVVSACIRLAESKNPPFFRQKEQTGTVAVIGAGLTGLSCALRLSRKKYSVTVFDSKIEAGGSLRSDAFLEDIKLQFSTVDTVFRFGEKITTLDALADFDAVFVSAWASGEDIPQRRGLFLSAGLGKTDILRAAAQTLDESRRIEAFLQSGTESWEDAESRVPAKHVLPHEGEPRVPRIIPADSSLGYTADECKGESNRCFGCDCRRCMDICDMLASFRKPPSKIAIEAYNDTTANPPFSSCTLTREAFSCNICGRCKEVCPVNIDLGRLFRLARAGRVEVGTEPKAFHDFWLRDFAFVSEKGSFLYPSARKLRYLFFPGCSLSSLAPDTVKGIYHLIASAEYAGGFVDSADTADTSETGDIAGTSGADIRLCENISLRHSGLVPESKHADNNFGFWHKARTTGDIDDNASAFGTSEAGYVAGADCLANSETSNDVGDKESADMAEDIGIAVNCCGAPLIWAGEEEKAAAHAKILRETWNSSGCPVFVFACSYCMSVFADILPEIPRLSVYEFIASSTGVCENLTNMDGESAAYAIFDPCVSVGNEAERKAARDIAVACNINVCEMDGGETGRNAAGDLAAAEHPHALPGMCCGYGGHTGFANASMQEKTISDAAGQSDLPYLVRCANCYEMFAKQGKGGLHLLDAILGRKERRRIPNLQEKRNNILELKAEFLPETAIIGRSYEPSVKLSHRAAEDAEKAYILEDEIRETLFIAEARGNYFLDTTTGRRTACLEKSAITIWIVYGADENGFIVDEVYSHRMRVGESR